MITFSRLGMYGRLGNQLFQIASTIGIAKKNNHSFIFPEWPYARYFHNPLPTGTLKNPTKIWEKHPWFYPIETGSGNYDLAGYFQSEKYFLQEDKLIRHFFQPAKEVDDYLNQKYGFLSKELTCSIHVRRKDFLEFRHTYPPLPLLYYEEAMETFNKETLFVIFSDDIAWCKSQFKTKNVCFIENGTAIEDLFLMSRCQHHIIANSSYSWWGAWLNPTEEKRVIAPSIWFGPGSSLSYKKRNESILPTRYQIIKLEMGYSQIRELFIYIRTKSFYFLKYKLKNIIPGFIRKKLYFYFYNNHMNNTITSNDINRKNTK